MKLTENGAKAQGAVRVEPGTDLNNLDPIKQLVNDLKLDIYEELPPPPTVLRINSQTYGTLGNFSLIIGKAKSRKTFFATMLAATCVSNNPNGTIAADLPPGKQRVIYIDTEQSKYHALKVANRIRRLSGIDRPNNLDMYYLRDTPYQQRVEIVDHIIQNSADAGIVIIDGIKDLVSDILSPPEATEMADRLLNWTTASNVHIAVLLHQNKTDVNARGHLGTELINKAETTVSVTRERDNKEVSRVEAEYTRDKEFDPFAFLVNEYGLPDQVAGWKKKDETKRRTEKTAPGELDEYKHFEILQQVAKNVSGKQPKFSEIIQQIKLAFQSATGRTIGDTKAREYLTYYQNADVIIQSGKIRSANSYYKVDIHNIGR